MVGRPEQLGGERADAQEPGRDEAQRAVRIALLGYVEFKPRAFEAGASMPGVAWSGGDAQAIEAGSAVRVLTQVTLPCK